MKKIFIVAIILTQAFLYNACNNQDSNKAEKSTVLVNQSDVDEGAKNFMKTASAGGVLEVELAKLAQKQASSAAVKEYAEMMIADHTRIYNELKKLATDKHILLPIDLTPEESAQLEKLKTRSGSEFDENYMRLMVDSHQKAVATFESGANNRDRDVNKFASAKLETLKTHLNSARSLFNTVVMQRQ